MKDRFTDEADANPEGLDELQLEAPANTLERFRKRASLIRGTRFVLERQFYGFWIVLNTFLKLLFKHVNSPVATPDEQQARDYRRAVQNSREGRQ